MAAIHSLLQNLLVTDAGYFPRAAGHRVERPFGSSTHLLIACLQGEGWVQGSDSPESVVGGDVVWLPADRTHSYGADETDPWTIVWAHFRGEELPHWQSELGWAAHEPLGITHISADRIPELGLDQVYNILEHGYSVQNLLEAGAALRTTFCALLRLSKEVGAARSAAERTALVRNQIARAPARAYRLEELAAAAGLSIAHFSLLFRQLAGFPPIDFLIRQRIKAACRLLDTTHMGVAQIGAEVGFADPYYFSRCFRRIMGCSPLIYRKIVKA